MSDHRAILVVGARDANGGANLRCFARAGAAQGPEDGRFADFPMGHEVAQVRPPQGRGAILFTGATASLRGCEGFAAFAGAKHAQRLGFTDLGCVRHDLSARATAGRSRSSDLF